MDKQMKESKQKFLSMKVFKRKVQFKARFKQLQMQAAGHRKIIGDDPVLNVLGMWMS